MQSFVACRDAGGDLAALRAARDELVVTIHDRVQGLVTTQAFRHQLTHEQEQDVLQDVLDDLVRKALFGFKGVSMGELHRYLRRVVHARSVDLIRDEKRGRDLAPGRLDRGWDASDDEHVAPADGRAAVLGWDADERDRELRDLRLRSMDVLDERQREVFQDMLEGVRAQETMTRLGLSDDNLYQVRRRARVAFMRAYRELDA